jgi:hypothetical protein
VILGKKSKLSNSTNRLRTPGNETRFGVWLGTCGRRGTGVGQKSSTRERLRKVTNGGDGGGLATWRPLESTIELWSSVKKMQLTRRLILVFGGYLPFSEKAMPS